MSASSAQELLAWLISSPVMRPDVLARQFSQAYPLDNPVPTVEQLRALKEQLSVDAWLYLLRGEEVGLPTANELMLQLELQAHVARVVDLITLDSGHETTIFSQATSHCQWVQYQLLHASAEQLPRVYYEQVTRALINEAWRLQAVYTQNLAQHPDMTRPSAAISSRPIALVPRPGFFGAIHHPGFGEWLVQELAQRPLPEIEPYLTLTWVFVTPNLPRGPGDHRRSFTRESITYLLDLLDGDWSYLMTGGRPQLARARDWFARHQSTVSDDPTDVLPGLTAQQIALIHIYQEIPISTRKAAQLAQQAKMQSGGKIYEKYRMFVRVEDRLNLGGKKRSYLIKDIETVLLHLTGPAKKRAEDELFKLK